MRHMLIPLAAAKMAAAAPAGISGDVLNGYAPTNVHGQPYSLRAHIGSATYTVSVETVGDTLLIGEIVITAPDVTPRMVPVPNRTSPITFGTGNFVGQPKVRLKGVPTGSAVKITVN